MQEHNPALLAVDESVAEDEPRNRLGVYKMDLHCQIHLTFKGTVG